MSLEGMKQKIAEIESRETISKTAVRKLRVLKKKVGIMEGTANESVSEETPMETESTDKPVEKTKVVKAVEKKEVVPKKVAQSPEKKLSKKQKKQQKKNQKEVQAKPSFTEDKEGDMSNLALDKSEEDSDEEEANVSNGASNSDENEESKVEEEDDDEDDEEEDEEEEDEEEEEEEKEEEDKDEEDEKIEEPVKKPVEKENKKEKNNTDKKENKKGDEAQGKKTRFVLFVGNISYEQKFPFFIRLDTTNRTGDIVKIIKRQSRALRIYLIEVGENVSVASLSSQANAGWRGRAEQIRQLQQKVSELQMKLPASELGPKGSLVLRRNSASRLPDREKKQQIENLTHELKEMENALNSAKKKLEIGRARVAVLESEANSTKRAMSALNAKSNHDDQLIEALQVTNFS
ncbi:unnamed protein product [Trichogramma brassicae]|uniref:Uncharacterized protein n=1 Tax=Trichogramma brassicae TaxID=86971 RepID=A0A6H5IPE6_9HYME|nr:unnamed protein product [Trichogramma brassicae]